jgi:hypothetical protein
MKGLVIPADVTQPVRVIDLHSGDGSLTNLQRDVGGYVDVQAHDVGDIWVNDEGRLIDLPVNPRVNYWLLNESDWAKQGIVSERQVLYGDVVFTGRPDARGDITAVSDDIVAYFEGLHIDQHALKDSDLRTTDIIVTDWPDFGEGPQPRDEPVTDEEALHEFESSGYWQSGYVDGVTGERHEFDHQQDYEDALAEVGYQIEQDAIGERRGFEVIAQYQDAYEAIERH